MKDLISVTPSEFKRNFGEIIDMCTDMCMTSGHETSVAIQENENSQTHIEIATVTPIDGGVKYSYNHELLKKYGIGTDNRMNKIESVIADAFEKSGLAEYARDNKIADILQKAMKCITKELLQF